MSNNLVNKNRFLAIISYKKEYHTVSYVANVREYFRKLGCNLNLDTVRNKYFDILIWKLCPWTMDLGHFVP